MQKIGKNTILFLTFLFATSIGFAEPKITAKVSSNRVSVDDSVTLSLEISGVNNVNPPWPLNLPGFQVQRAGQTRSVQWVNGETTTLISFNYILTPTKTGTLQIPSIAMTQGKNTYKSNPIDLVVQPSSTASAPHSQPSGGGGQPSGQAHVPTEGLKPVFMSAKVDTSKAYVGEQIILTVQFLRRPNVRLASQPRYSEPDMTGFLVEPLKQREFNTTLNGARYIVTELRYALFPTSDGDFAIGNASINLAVRAEADPFDPNSFFESFFGRSKMVRLNTKAIPIRVRSLPSNKPAHFSGAVGQYNIQAKVDNTSPEVGKPVNFVVTVEGVGNIKSIKEPDTPPLTGFRKYESIANSQINNQGDRLTGSKEFKILLIPQVSGQLTIPSIPFVYFDPNQHQYITKQTNEMAFRIQPGTLSSQTEDPSLPADVGQVVEGVRVVEKNIRFLKSGDITRIEKTQLNKRHFLLINLFPPIFAIGAILGTLRSKHRRLYAADYRSKKALKRAQKTLKKAEKAVGSADLITFYGLISSALKNYLADKIHISVSGMVWGDLNQKLQERGVNENTRNQVQHIWDEADMAQYASSSFSDNDRENSLRVTRDILFELDKTLS